MEDKVTNPILKYDANRNRVIAILADCIYGANAVKGISTFQLENGAISCGITFEEEEIGSFSAMFTDKGVSTSQMTMRPLVNVGKLKKSYDEYLERVKAFKLEKETRESGSVAESVISKVNAGKEPKSEEAQTTPTTNVEKLKR